MCISSTITATKGFQSGAVSNLLLDLTSSLDLGNIQLHTRPHHICARWTYAGDVLLECCYASYGCVSPPHFRHIFYEPLKMGIAIYTFTKGIVHIMLATLNSHCESRAQTDGGNEQLQTITGCLLWFLSKRFLCLVIRAWVDQLIVSFCGHHSWIMKNLNRICEDHYTAVACSREVDNYITWHCEITLMKS